MISDSKPKVDNFKQWPTTRISLYSSFNKVSNSKNAMQVAGRVQTNCKMVTRNNVFIALFFRLVIICTITLSLFRLVFKMVDFLKMIKDVRFRHTFISVITKFRLNTTLELTLVNSSKFGIHKAYPQDKPDAAKTVTVNSSSKIL